MLSGSIATWNLKYSAIGFSISSLNSERITVVDLTASPTEQGGDEIENNGRSQNR